MYPAGTPDIRARMVSLPNGIVVRVLESGRPTGEPVLLLHGWAACVYTFRDTIPALAAAGRRVLAFDLRGHGLSAKPASAEQYATGALIDDVRQVLSECGVKQSDIVGHSLGGGLALRFSLAHPSLVRRLVLASPVGLTTIGIQRVGAALTPSVTARLARYLTPRWLTNMLIRGAYADPRRVSPAVVDQYWAPSQFPNYFRAARALLHRFDWRPLEASELGQITAPTVVILGSADRLIQGAEEGARGIRGASIVTLNQAGHLGVEECPREFNEAVIAFLNR